MNVKKSYKDMEKKINRLKDNKVTNKYLEAIARSCSVKKVLLKICKIRRKGILLESLFNKVADMKVF